MSSNETSSELSVSLIVLTAVLIFIRPTNRMPNPMQMVPALPAACFLTNMIRMMPIVSARGARLSDLKKYRMLVEPACRSMSRMIWAVIAVPTLAPRTIPIDWWNERNPAPTRPTVRTIVAVELWIMQVTMRPSRNPITGFVVTRARAAFMAPPELLFSPSPMMRMP